MVAVIYFMILRKRVYVNNVNIYKMLTEGELPNGDNVFIIEI